MQRLCANDVMAEKVFSVSPELSLLELERDLAAQRITGAPVIDHGRVVGIVSRADVDAPALLTRAGLPVTRPDLGDKIVPARVNHEICTQVTQRGRLFCR